MTDFLYPFLGHDEDDLDALLDDLTRSAHDKADISAALVESTREQLDGDLRAAARDVAECLARGGRLLTFGNGGSSTDASGLAALFATPPHGPPLPAVALTGDSAVLTALGNDVGFPLVFSRQVIAYAAPDDVAVGFSTSGNSANLLMAFDAARDRGLLTVGFAGYDGGDMARVGLDHCLVVRSDSIHRIQETQAALGFALWRMVHAELEGSHAHA